jgi:hypothetical protein
MFLDDIRHLISGDVEVSRDVDFSAGFIAFDNVNRIIFASFKRSEIKF